jgi:hypothetical protein
MADQEKDEQMRMDEMLDSLLANYSSAEPRPGLENRILANLILANPRDAGGREARLGWSFKWVWMAAVGAAIVLGVLLIGGKQRGAQPPSTVVKGSQPARREPQVQSSVPAAADERTKIYRHKERVAAVPQSEALALNRRPSVFPTPTPLSEQEKLMFTYLANTPHEVVVAQVQRNDQKEEEAFWKDREESSADRRSTTNR